MFEVKSGHGVFESECRAMERLKDMWKADNVGRGCKAAQNVIKHSVMGFSSPRLTQGFYKVDVE